MRTEQLVLWIAASAVFLLVCPAAGIDGRNWQALIFVAAGLLLATKSLSGDRLLGIFSAWILVLAAWHRSAGALDAVLFLLAFLGLAAVAREVRAGGKIVGAIVAANVAAFALQVCGLWVPLLRLVAPEASMTIYNQAHPHIGLAASSPDLACVLAIGIPILAAGGSRGLAVAVAGGVCLLWTGALSAIVAGAAGCIVVFWPRIRSASREAVVAGACLVPFAVAAMGFDAEIASAIRDDRWAAWGQAANLWLAQSPAVALAGHGLASWQHAGVMRTGPAGPEHWGELHFDLLQLGYEAGLVGVALAVAIAVAAFARCARSGRRDLAGALTAIAICQFGHFPFRLAAPAVVIALVFGATQEQRQCQ